MRLTQKDSGARRGVTLVETMVYCGLVLIVFNFAVFTYYQLADHSRGLRRVSDDITRALQAGEQWRGDVRAGTKSQLSDEGRSLAIAGPNGALTYRFQEDAIWREAPGGAPAERLLDKVRTARWVQDDRAHTAAWRWEIELKRSARKGQFAPLFSFLATPNRTDSP